MCESRKNSSDVKCYYANGKKRRLAPNQTSESERGFSLQSVQKSMLTLYPKVPNSIFFLFSDKNHSSVQLSKETFCFVKE